jgi:hypothetical protein
MSGAARVLGELLVDLLGDVEGQIRAEDAAAAVAAWVRAVERMRRDAAWDAVRAELLESADPLWTRRAEIHDGPDLMVTPRTDAATDGLRIVVSPAGDLLSLRLEKTLPGGLVREVRGAVVTRSDAAPVFGRLLAEMVGTTPASSRSAQEAYRQLLKHVGAALRRDGFKGSGGLYAYQRGDHEVSVSLSKSRYSTQDAIDYDVSIGVYHQPTVRAFEAANFEARDLGKVWEWPPAGQWGENLDAIAGRPHSWRRLGCDDDVAEAGEKLVTEIRVIAYPAIEAELARPLVAPTPPLQRLDQEPRRH